MKKKRKKNNRYCNEVGGKLVIDMNRVSLDKADHSVGFRTGRHMTEKDRPRKKRWSIEDY